MESLAQQTYAFLMTILAGGVVGLLFDLYRVVRWSISTRHMATALTDLLFWIVVTPTVFAMLLAGNWGELRFYVLIGLGVGLVLYFQSLSSLVIWGFSGALRGVGQGMGALAHLIVRVLTFPGYLLFGAWRGGRSSRRFGWGRVPFRPKRPRLAMAWQRLSLSRLFGRFGG